MFFYILLTVHLSLCIVLIGLVLLQQGKGADMGATLGGGSNTLFGAAGATAFITKLTTGVAIAFMATSILLINHYDKFASAPGVIAAEDPVKSLMGAGAEKKTEEAAPAAGKPAAPEAKAPEAKAPEKPAEEKK